PKRQSNHGAERRQTDQQDLVAQPMPAEEGHSLRPLPDVWAAYTAQQEDARLTSLVLEGPPPDNEHQPDGEGEGRDNPAMAFQRLDRSVDQQEALDHRDSAHTSQTAANKVNDCDTEDIAEIDQRE